MTNNGTVFFDKDEDGILIRVIEEDGSFKDVPAEDDEELVLEAFMVMHQDYLISVSYEFLDKFKKIIDGEMDSETPVFIYNQMVNGEHVATILNFNINAGKDLTTIQDFINN